MNDLLTFKGRPKTIMPLSSRHARSADSASTKSTHANPFLRPVPGGRGRTRRGRERVRGKGGENG